MAASVPTWAWFRDLKSQISNLKCARSARSALLLFALLPLGTLAAETLQVDPFFNPELRVEGGTVLTAAVQADGKILIGGDFTWVDGERRVALARLNADGTLDPTFDAQINVGRVHAIALQPSGRIVVGGLFAVVGGQSRASLAGLTSTGALDGTFAADAGVNGTVRALAVTPDGSFYVGGLFTQAAGASRPYLAKFDANGTLTSYAVALFAYDPGVTSLLLLPDQRLLVGGANLLLSPNEICGGLVLLSEQGNRDSAWTARTYPSIGALARDAQGRVYAGVGSTSSGSWPYGRSVVRWDATLVPDVSWVPQVSGRVSSLLPLADGKLLAAGELWATDETRALTRLLPSGAIDSTFRLRSAPATVHALVERGETRLAVGVQSSLGAAALLALDAAGNPGQMLGTRLQQPGAATASVALADGGVVVAGIFDAVGLEPAQRIARLTRDGRVDRTFRAVAGSGTITAMLEQSDGRVVVRAEQGTGPGGRAAVARLNRDGSLDETYSTTMSTYGGPSRWARLPDDRILMLSYGRLYRYATTGAIEAQWALDDSYPSLFALQPDGKVVVAGGFAQAGPSRREQRYVARYNADGTFDDTFTSPFVGSTGWSSLTALYAAPGNQVLLTGAIQWADQSYTGFGRLTATGERDASFSSAVTAGQHVVDVHVRADGTALAAGAFDVPRVRHVDVNGAFTPTFDAVIGGMGTVTMALTPGVGGEVIATGRFLSLGGWPRYGLARITPRTSFARVPQAVSVTPGGTLTVTPELGTNSGATYQWRRNGQDIAGATGANLSIPGFDAALHAGNYTLVVTDANGTTETDPAVVVADAAPVILTQPSGLIEEVGGTISLSVVVSGSPTPAFQWQKDGVTIPGATARTLTVSGVKAQDAGRYSVVVTNRAGSVTSEAVAVEVRTIRFDATFTPHLVRNVRSSLSRIVLRPDGRLLASGSFTAVNGVAARSPVLLQTDGGPDSTFVAAYNGTPLAVLADGRVLVQGPMTNGTWPLRLLDGTGREVAGFKPEASSEQITATALPDGFLLRGSYGDFTVGNVSSVRRLLRLRLDGTADPGFAPALPGTEAVTVLGVQADGRFYVAIGGYYGPCTVVRLNASGSTDATFPALSIASNYSWPRGLVQPDGKLVIDTGRYDERGLLRFNADGTPDAAFGTALKAATNATLELLGAYSDNRLLVRSGSTWLRLESSGAQDASFQIRSTYYLQFAGVQPDGTIVARDQEHESLGRRSALRRFDAAGTELIAGMADFGVNASVRRVGYQPGGGIYVAGEFDWVDGVRMPNFARLTAAGALDPRFVPDLPATAVVRALAVQADGRPVLAWSINSGDVTTHRVGRFEPEGAQDPTLRVTFDRAVYELAVDAQDRIVAAGAFSMAAGVERAKVARFMPDGALDLSFVPNGPRDELSVIGLDADGRVYVAPGEIGWSGRVLRLLATGENDASWDVLAAGRVMAVIPHPDGRVTLVGHFQSVNGVLTSGVARLLANGEPDPTLTPLSYVAFPDWSINTALREADTGKLVLGTGVWSHNGLMVRGLARITPAGSFDYSLLPAMNNSPVGGPAVRALARRSDGDLLAAGDITSVDGTAVSGLARWTVREFSISFPDPAVIVPVGGSQVLAMDVTGPGPFTYQWQKDGVDLAGATQATYTVTNELANGGHYTLRVTQGANVQVSDPLRVGIARAPVITRQPESVAVELGGAAVLRVTVAASPTPTYQWSRNGKVVPGPAGPALLLPAVSAADVGSYTVTVTNAHGSVTSAAATVTAGGMQADEGFVPVFHRVGSDYVESLVSRALRLADGRWLVAGAFSGADGVRSRWLARFHDNGRIDASYVEPILSSAVRSLARLPDGRIMVGTGDGSYNTGMLVNRLLATGEQDPTFVPLRGQGYVVAFAARDDGAVYAGGSFRLGATRSIARLRPDGTLDDGFVCAPGDYDTISSLAVSGDGVVATVEGSYWSEQSNPVQRFHSDGRRDGDWALALTRNGSRAAASAVLAAAGGRIIVAGTFSKVGTVDRAGLARINADGTLDTTWTTPVTANGSNQVRLWPRSDGSFVVGGSGVLTGRYAADRGIQIAADGTPGTNYTLGTTHACTLLDVAPSGEALARGGTTYVSQGSFPPAILRFGADGRVAAAFSPAFFSGAAVKAVTAMADGRVLVAGTFSQVDGQPRLHVVRLLPGGAVDPTFEPAVLVPSSGYSSDTPEVVSMLVQSDGRIVIAGRFETFNGAVRNHLVRLNADGSFDGAYNPAPDGTVNAIALDASGKLLVAGSFFTIGGGRARGLARLQLDGSIDPSFDAGLTESARALALQPDGMVLYVVGNYDGRLRRARANGARDPAFPLLTARVSTVALLPDGRIATWRMDQSERSLDVLRADGTPDPAWSVRFSQGYSSEGARLLVQSDGRLLVAGNFSLVNDVRRAGLVRLLTNGQVDRSFFPGTGGSPAPIAAMAQQPDGSLLFGGPFVTFDERPFSGLVRYVDRPFFVRVREAAVISAPGAATRLRVEVTGTGEFSYAWKHDGVLVAGATTAELTLASTVEADAGEYVCEVTAGGITVTANPIELVVGVVPSITTEPVAAKIAPGTTLTLSVTAAGDAPLTYQWYQNGTLLADASTATLSLSSVSTNASGLYQVVVSNRLGVARSTLVPVLVGSAPTLSLTGGTYTLTEGDSLSLSANVSGTPSPSVQWLRDNVALPDGQSSWFYVWNVKTTDAGTYRVVATNGFGEVTSAEIVVAVNPRSGTGGGTTDPAVAPTITSQPADRTVQANAYVTFSVSATGTPSPTYQWRKDGSPIYGSNSAHWVISNAQIGDSGVYDVVVTNTAGSVTSTGARLTVRRAPYFTQTPAPVHVMVGGSASLRVSVLAEPAATFQWQKDSVVIPGATGTTLALHNLQPADAGYYSVTATNELGSVSAGATVRVHNALQTGLNSGLGTATAAPNVTTTFAIEGLTPKRILIRGVGPSLTALGTTGAMPDPILLLTDALGSYVAHNNDWNDAPNAAEIVHATLRLGVVALGTGSKDSALLVTLAPGNYTATVRAADGANGRAMVQVYAADEWPRLVSLAVSGDAGAGPGHEALTAGFVIQGSVARPYLIRALGPVLGLDHALADPRLGIYTNGVQVAANDNWGDDATEAALVSAAAVRLGAVPLSEGSKDAAVLVTLPPGSHVAQVTAPVGTQGETILEIIEADSLRNAAIAPWVVLQPEDIDAAAGSAVTLRALVGGAPVPTYQWRKDGVDVSGATSAVLTLPSLQEANTGVYTLRALNSAGTANTVPVNVTIGSGIRFSATQAVVGGVYTAGSVVTITNTILFSSTASSLGWEATLPEGWSYATGGANEGDVKPLDGATGTLSWSWTTVPASPVTFTYRVNVPEGETERRTITATASLRTSLTSSQRTIAATPGALPLIRRGAFHAADTNYDFRFSLGELMRVIELFNTRNGTVRTGAYGLGANTTDGFASAPERSPTATLTLGGYHSADVNRDAKISLSEVMRVISLFNYRAGTVRTGQYRLELGTEDGFAAGP